MKSFHKSITIIAFGTCLILGCHKDANNINKQSLETNYLGFIDLTQNYILINQAVTIYDSTRIKDSIDYVEPPTDRYYVWTAISANGCDSIIGNDSLPIVNFSFHCSGIYSITAKMYSSATDDFVGNTDTIQIQVTSDVLPRSLPILINDTLNVRASATWVQDSINTPIKETCVQLYFTTQNNYKFISYPESLDYSSSISDNAYAYVFSDTIKIWGYPFANYVDQISRGNCGIEMHGLTADVPANISITWLGVTYTGTITLTNERNVTWTWDNNGAVKFPW